MAIRWMTKKKRGASHRRHSEPTLTLGKAGIYLNTGATLAMGNPEAVEVGLDLTALEVVLRPVDKNRDDPTAWALGYNKDRRGGAVLGVPWLNKGLKTQLGLDLNEVHHLKADRIQGNILYLKV